MTTPRLIAAAAAVVAGFAALALLLMPAPGSNRVVAHAAPTVAAARTAHPGGTAVSSTLDDRDGLLAAVAPSTDLPQHTADAIEQTADRICEAFTDDVPVTTIEQTVAAQLGVTLPEAHDLVETTAVVRCYPEPVSTTTHPAAAPAHRTAAPHVTTAPAPAATRSTPAAPTATPDTVQQQLPQEVVGRAIDCPTGTVGHVVDADGHTDC
jgi:hypothetical protein